jgi:hypothetical protein
MDLQYDLNYYFYNFNFTRRLNEKVSLTLAEGSDAKEGEASKWEIGGDFPPPVALFVAMHTRSQSTILYY